MYKFRKFQRDLCLREGEGFEKGACLDVISRDWESLTYHERESIHYVMYSEGRIIAIATGVYTLTVLHVWS